MTENTAPTEATDDRLIYKYTLRGLRGSTLNLRVLQHWRVANLPYDARIISIGMQENEFVAWAIVDPLQTPDPEPRIFFIAPTGVASLPAEIVGPPLMTACTRVEYGPYVFHVFALPRGCIVPPEVRDALKASAS